MNTGSIFDGIEDAETNGNNEKYFEGEGRFVCRLTEAASGTTSGFEKYNFFAVHFEVMKAENYDKGKPLYEGDHAKKVIKIQNEYSLRDIKSMVAALAEKPPSEVTSDLCETLCQDDGERFIEMWRDNFGHNPVAVVEVKAREDKETGKTYYNLYPEPVSDKEKSELGLI